MKILVTGGAGFIGSHLVKALYEQGHDVVVVDNLNDFYNPQLKKDRLEKFLDKDRHVFCETDITDKKELSIIFDSFQFDAVVHLAAYAGLQYSLENPQAYYLNNVIGTNNILEFIEKHRIEKLIFGSSSSVYGDTKDLPYRESLPTGNQLHPYAVTKRINELTMYSHHKSFDYDVTVLRFFNVYGTWARPDLVFSKYLDLIKKGEVISINNFGKMQRGFTYVDDIVRGIISALEKNLGFEIINLGNDDTEMLDEVVMKLEEILGIEAKKQYTPMPEGEVAATSPDISKAIELLGFKIETKFEDGLRKLVNWYESYYNN